jgi:hypothetical protein
VLTSIKEKESREKKKEPQEWWPIKKYMNTSSNEVERSKGAKRNRKCKE